MHHGRCSSTPNSGERLATHVNSDSLESGQGAALAGKICAVLITVRSQTPAMMTTESPCLVEALFHQITEITATHLFILACSIWSGGALLSLLSGITLFKVNNRSLSFLVICGSLAALYGSVKSFWTSETFLVNVGGALPKFGLASLSCQSDALSALFIALLAVVSIASTLFSASCAEYKTQFFKLQFFLLLGVLLVFLSNNAIAFLVFWEIMSVAAASLITYEHERHRAQRAALGYLTASRIATAFFTAAFLWMQHLTGSFNFADWSFAAGDTFPAALLILLGVACKAGLWPMHVYLPAAYAEAPGPAAALISGAVSKVAIYVMLRLLFLGHCSFPLITYMALILGTISCLWGVLFALVERDLKRLLAFSSVENIGLIMMATALAMLARRLDIPGVEALAISCALLHTLNHGLFKSLLMLSVASIERASKTRELTRLGGLAKRLPWTMMGFFVGALSICALPPTNGFVSKWLLYQAFFQLSFASAPLYDRAIALALIGILAFVGALSLACYTKALGIAFLGRPRSQSAANARQEEIENGKLSGISQAQIILAAICIILGTSASICLGALSPALTLLTGGFVNAANLFPIPLGQISLIGLALASAVYILILGPKTQDVSTYITWDCGYGPLSARAEETGSSFSDPIGRIFAQILQLKVSTKIDGKDRRHFPDAIKVETKMSPLLETHFYSQLMKGLNWLSLTITRLQTGSIHVHLAYVFLTLVVLVLLGTVL